MSDKISNQYLILDSVINNVKDPTLRTILKYKDHPSILAIQNNCKNRINLLLKKWIWEALKKKFITQSSDIPTKIIKENVDIFAELVWKSINSSSKSSTFPSCLKSADVTPLHKKVRKNKKDNYRLVGILANSI